MPFRFRIKSTEASSAKYGPCEVCKRPVSDVHIQATDVLYDGRLWLHRGHAFGHRECLISARPTA